MSQLSHISEGGFSDIISDVDKFIEEHGMVNDVNLLSDIPGKHQEFLNDNEEDEEYKPAPPEFFGDPDYPLQANGAEERYPPEQPTDLCSEEYPGPLNFEVYIVPNGQKTPWEYSHKLNKIFITINLKFPIAFSVRSRPDADLFVRATPVFSQAQFFQEPVQRCVGHQHPQDSSNTGLPEHVYQHIIRCGNDAVKYYGSKTEGSRLNIVLPLAPPQAGTDIVREFFHFVCKNSCPQGMNRRPIEIVFTLEDRSGQVLGRRVVAVRVCSCPKRDKEKEEKDMEKNTNPTLQGKKRKLAAPPASLDTRIFPININIVGRNNRIKLLEFAVSLMAGEILKLEGSNRTDAPFRKAYNEIAALLNKSTSE